MALETSLGLDFAAAFGAREHDGQIGWMRVVCSGSRPTGSQGK